MAQLPTITVQIAPATRKIVTGLHVVAETLAELHDDLPWRDDVTKAQRALRYVLRHWEVETEQGSS